MQFFDAWLHIFDSKISTNFPSPYRTWANLKPQNAVGPISEFGQH